MEMYNAAVVVATKDTGERLVDQVMDQLAAYHVAVGTSPRGGSRPGSACPPSR